MPTRRDSAQEPPRPLALAASCPASSRARPGPPTRERDGRVLVVIQLDGGNDGINTVVPFGDEGYAKHRRELRLPAETADQDRRRRRPAPGDAAGRPTCWRAAGWRSCRGSAIPTPTARTSRAWRSGRPARLDQPRSDAPGWLGRGLDGGRGRDGPAAVHRRRQTCPAAWSRGGRSSTSFADASRPRRLCPIGRPGREPADGDSPRPTTSPAFVRRSRDDAYATAAELEAATPEARDDRPAIPSTALARRLDLVARSIKAGSPARVYYLIQPGYDTHAVQFPTHARLLGELSGALARVPRRPAAARLADRVLVLAFSEFGRRPEENGSLGTDHGTAGPVFLAGPSVKAGLAGKTPSLGDLQDGDLKWSTDFRRVYATVLEDWLGLSPDPILGGRFDTLPLIAAPVRPGLS